jgi:hypothetical protein
MAGTSSTRAPLRPTSSSIDRRSSVAGTAAERKPDLTVLVVEVGRAVAGLVVEVEVAVRLAGVVDEVNLTEYGFWLNWPC